MRRVRGKLCRNKWGWFTRCRGKVKGKLRRKVKRKARKSVRAAKRTAPRRTRRVPVRKGCREVALYMIGGQPQWRCFSFSRAKKHVQRHSPNFVGHVMSVADFRRLALEGRLPVTSWGRVSKGATPRAAATSSAGDPFWGSRIPSPKTEASSRYADWPPEIQQMYHTAARTSYPSASFTPPSFRPAASAPVDLPPEIQQMIGTVPVVETREAMPTQQMSLPWDRPSATPIPIVMPQRLLPAETSLPVATPPKKKGSRAKKPPEGP